MKKDSVQTVKAFYDADASNEWKRFEKHIVEFELTKRFMNRYIHAGDKVLDVGGGPGRYSLYLAHKGCDVTLVDLAPNHVAFALEKAKEENVFLRGLSGDAREIDKIVQGETFDHVLLMGPLYHLLEESDRKKTVENCLKLLRPNGLLYVSFISSYGGIIYAMKFEPEIITAFDEIPLTDNPFTLFEEDRPFSGDSFTNAHFYRQQDILPFMSQFPLEKVHFFGQESFLAPCEPNILSQPQEIIDKWLDVAEKVCERENLLSFSEHFMYIGRKTR